MLRFRLTISFLFLLFKTTIAQSDISIQVKHCNQYQTIINYLTTDTSNLKYYDVHKIWLRAYYRHSAMRQMVKHSYKGYLKETSEQFKSVEVDRNDKADSIVYSSEFKTCDCINNNSISVDKPNVDVLFDRYSDNIIFVRTRYNRPGDSFGQTFIFWFDNNQKSTFSNINYRE